MTLILTSPHHTMKRPITDQMRMAERIERARRAGAALDRAMGRATVVVVEADVVVVTPPPPPASNPLPPPVIPVIVALEPATVTVEPPIGDDVGDDDVPSPVRIRSLVKAASKVTGISVTDILSSRRSKNFVTARRIVCVLARRHTLRSLPEIGLALGKRDHTTVLHAMNTGDDLERRDPDFAEAIRKTIVLARQIEQQT